MDDNFAPEYQEVPRDAARHISTNYFNPTIWAQIKGMAATFIESKALPAHIQNVPQAVMVLQAGLEMGMKPMEAINSVYIVNGATNIWGKAVVRRLREHGYFIEYLEEDDQHCKARVFKKETGEDYTETFLFTDAEASGWTHAPVWENGRKTDKLQLKVGWREGQNRKLKMRYGVLSSIIKSYIPDVLGSASDIAEVAEDVTPIVLEAQEVAQAEKKSKGKVEDLRGGERGSLGSFISKSREQVTPVAEEGEVVDEAPKKETKKKTSKKAKPEEELHQEVHPGENEAVNPTTLDKARKEYFAVAKELGYEGEDAKNMIKEFYEVQSFNDIDLNQLKAYILSLRNQLEAEK